MATRRHKRSEEPRNPALLVSTLRAFRGILIKVQGDINPCGAAYKLTSNIMKAVDALADHLTGKPRYFSIGGSTASEGAMKERAEWDLRERGELPWLGE